MNRFATHIIFVFITIVLAGGWINSCNKNKEVIVETSTVDTVYVDTIIHIHDTVFRDIIVAKEIKTIDTLYIKQDTAYISLPIIQKHFSEKNLFDIWISGVEPLQLDSTIIHKQIEYKKEIIHKNNIVPQKTQFLKTYVGVGFLSCGGSFSPTIGVSLNIKEKWLVSANKTLNNDIYSINIKYKIQ